MPGKFSRFVPHFDNFPSEEELKANDKYIIPKQDHQYGNFTIALFHVDGLFVATALCGEQECKFKVRRSVNRVSSSIKAVFNKVEDHLTKVHNISVDHVKQIIKKKREQKQKVSKAKTRKRQREYTNRKRLSLIRKQQYEEKKEELLKQGLTDEEEINEKAKQHTDQHMKKLKRRRKIMQMEDGLINSHPNHNPNHV
jgi:hypothetical protein